MTTNSTLKILMILNHWMNLNLVKTHWKILNRVKTHWKILNRVKTRMRMKILRMKNFHESMKIQIIAKSLRTAISFAIEKS